MIGAQCSREYGEEEMERVLAAFPPRKRAVYEAGLQEELNIPVHSKVTAFIKEENVPFNPAKDKPRLIQFRNPVFLAHLLCLMKPIEHAFYHNRFAFNRFQKLTCAKGMDQLKRMRTLSKMVSGLKDPYVVGLDGSAFDAHVCKAALEDEWQFYDIVAKRAGFSGTSRAKLRAMGRAQLRNRVRAKAEDGVVKYVVDGNRMSGDLNTGLGNTVLQSLFIATAMDILNIPEKDWRMLVDGDDSVLMVSGEHVAKLDRLPEIFELFSQDVKVSEVCRVSEKNMEVIEFCQSRPVWVEGFGWRLVRSPQKVYNGYKMVNLWYRTLAETQAFFATVAPAEMIFAAGLPVHSALFRCFHRLSGSARPLDVVQRRFWLRHCKLLKDQVPSSDEVHWLTRESYARAFGIEIADQLSIENELDSWNLSHLEGVWRDLGL
jgi:hypothetical protein